MKLQYRSILNFTYKMQYSFVLNLTMKLSQRMQLSTEFYNRDAVQTCTEFNHELSAHSDHHHEPDICILIITRQRDSSKQKMYNLQQGITHI